MAKKIKPISNWSKIFLDTSILLNLFIAQRKEGTGHESLFIKKLINYLSKSKDGSGKEREFYISTVTITEILCREHDSEKVKKIMRSVDANNVTFTSFNLKTSLRFNHVLWSHLQEATLNKYAEEFGFLSGEYMMAREWITRDFMILINGVENNCDVILTTDKRTFYPLGEKVNAPVVLTLNELFESSDEFILSYHEERISAELLNLPKTQYKKGDPKTKSKDKEALLAKESPSPQKK